MTADAAAVDVLLDVLPQLQVALDDPVHHAAGLLLDALGRVTDDLALELAAHAVAVHERADASDADRILEEGAATPLHLEQQRIEPAEPGLEVAQHLVVEGGDLAVDVVDRLDVIGEQFQRLERGILVGGREAESHVEGVEQLESDALLLVERAQQVVLHGGESARRPQLRIATVRARGKRLARGDREDLGRAAQQRARVLRDEGGDLVALCGVGQDVDLVDDEHDLLAPRPDLLEEKPLALGERTVGGGDEKHEIGARHEVARQFLVPAHDGVRARRVDDVQLAQQLGRVRALEQVGLQLALRDVGPPAQQVDTVGGRRDALGQHALAQQRIDEAGLSRIELARHDQQEELVELGARLLEVAEVRGVDVGLERLESSAEPLEQFLLPRAQLLLAL